MPEERYNFLYTLFPVVLLAFGVLWFSKSHLPSKENTSGSAYNVLGKANAPITITEFSDFQCPYCGRFFSTTLPALRKKYIDTGKVKFIYKDFPLSFHPNAMPAALASHCAGEQGKYWEYHDLLFKNQSNLSEKTYYNLAEKLSLKMNQFKNCYETKKYSKKIEASVAEGKKKKITGTPGFFVNSVKLEGALPIAVFDEVIKRIQEGKEKEIDGQTVTSEVLKKQSSKALNTVTKHDPPVQMLILTDKNCQECNPKPVINFTRNKVFPNVKVRTIDIQSAEGKNLVKLFQINNLPAYFFTNSIEKAGMFNRIQPSLIKKESLYLINPSMVDSQKTLHPPQAGNAPFKGNPNAKVTVLEYSDFQCPYCGRFYMNTLPKVDKNYIQKGRIKFVYKQYPLTSLHKFAFKAAMASLCANDQDKFWKYHDEIFNKQGALSDEALLDAAKMTQLNLTQFKTCLQSEKYKERVDQEIKEGEAAGINATPSFFINGQKVVGALPYEKFKKHLDRALAQTSH